MVGVGGETSDPSDGDVWTRGPVTSRSTARRHPYSSNLLTVTVDPVGETVIEPMSHCPSGVVNGNGV